MTGQHIPERKVLTTQQLEFIEQYMIDRNASQAGIRLGKSVNWGCNMLAQKIVRDEVERRTAERSRRVDISKDDIVRELKRMAFYDVRKLFRPDGKVIENPNDLNEDDARGLVNFGVVVLNKDGDHIIKLEPGNKMKALELLGKSIGMFKDVTEHQGAVVHYHTDFGDEEKPEEKTGP